MKASHLVLLIAGAMICVPTAHACGTRPERLTLDQIRDESDVIIRGEFVYTFGQKDLPYGAPNWLVGNITAQQVKKGPPAKSYSIHHSAIQFFCSGAGWEPDYEPLQGRSIGEFYLQRRADNRYIILGYKP